MFNLRIFVFTAVKFCSILHRRVNARHLHSLETKTLSFLLVDSMIIRLAGCPTSLIKVFARCKSCHIVYFLPLGLFYFSGKKLLFQWSRNPSLAHVRIVSLNHIRQMKMRQYMNVIKKHLIDLTLTLVFIAIVT